LDKEIHAHYNVCIVIRKILLGYVVLFVVVAVTGSAPREESLAAFLPLPPDTGNATFRTGEEKIAAAPSRQPSTPARLSIPAIKLDSTVVAVGVNPEGEMDVPPGTTKSVGWYEYGTRPGDTGSAVMGAHVYAAFAKLNRLAPGASVYVTAADNQRLHFVVNKIRTYKLSELKPEDIFTSASGKHLNLITCAGKFVRAQNTYDHRLVVYATLVE
jgi:sortase (surface protein transpeptidase)